MATLADLQMIGKLLGHTQSATTARYAHFADDPLKTATGLAFELRAIDDSMDGIPKQPPGGLTKRNGQVCWKVIPAKAGIQGLGRVDIWRLRP
ncbi:MAG: hypothetical protein HQL86_05145 [Magnetococcales bacterium]|nr:hypothetical protein [Magnetococcales bacterium]